MEKKNTGLIVLVVILSILVIGLGGFIVYDKLLSEKDLQINDTQPNKDKNKNELKLSSEELEKYLSYVPIKEELDDYEDLYDYTNDAYSGNLETVTNLSEELLMAKAFTLSQKSTTKEKLEFPWCGDLITCEADEYVTIDEFNNTIKEIYNIKYLERTDFTISGGGVNKVANYYVSYYGRGAFDLIKINKIVDYEIKNDDLIIYEQAGFINFDDNPNSFDLLKSTNSNSIIKTFDESKYNTNLGYDEIINFVKLYMESNSKDFNIFKHTFKLNENNTYYWYSTEISE